MCSYDPDVHHRRSIRLEGYDYAQVGAYLVTIYGRNRECLLGEIADGKSVLSQYGHLVRLCWVAIPQHFSDWELDFFVVMPNHVHINKALRRELDQSHPTYRVGR